jgi:hypothetical protein
MNNFFNRFSHRFALSLVLLAPFINFIQFNDYHFWRQEVITLVVWLVIFGFALSWLYPTTSIVRKTVITALIVTIALSFFPFWQNSNIILITFFIVLLLAMLLAMHVEKITTIIFLVFIIGLLILPSKKMRSQSIVINKSVATVNKKLPPIVYIILDEHIGINAIPADIAFGQQLKQSLRAFYINNGFHLFNAYSHYHETYNSIPNLLNYSFNDRDNAYFNTTSVRHLQQNKFFDLLAQKGYQFKVYEVGDYLDYCEQANIPIISCYRYPSQSLGILQYSPLPMAQRLLFLVKGFLLQSMLYQKLLQLLNVSNWFWYDAHISTLSMLDEFAQLKIDLTKPANGTVFFAHIFAPHSPYMYGADCRLMPIDQWRIGAILLRDAKNTPASRALTYSNYNQQTLCVEKQMQAVFAVMRKAHIYDQAIIIVHGDHGSRIALHEPYIENKTIFTQQDFQDYFPTLFAVKAPAYIADNNKLTDLPTLLAALTHVITGDKITVPQKSPYVYLTAGETIGLPMEKVRIDQFKN